MPTCETSATDKLNRPISSRRRARLTSAVFFVELTMGTDIVPTELSACTKRIRAANDKFRKSFVEFITVVGAELRKGQELLASHKAGFQNWCKDEFGWSPQRAHQFIDAADIIKQLTSTIVDVDRLPTSESQCRELSCVPEDDLCEVWQQICESANGHDITAKLIREATAQYRPVETNGEFDPDKRGDRLRDWLRRELNEWPPEHRHEALHWVKQIITKEFKE